LGTLGGIVDPAFRSNTVGTRIRERRILKMLIGPTFDRIDVEDRTLEGIATLGDEAVLMP